jgi:hypothetical protein
MIPHHTDNGWIPEPVLMSTMLAEEVVQVSNRIRNSSTTGSIKTAMRTITMKGRPRERGPEAGPQAATVSLTLTAARLGDVAFLGMGAEVFTFRALRVGATSIAFDYVARRAVSLAHATVVVRELNSSSLPAL